MNIILATGNSNKIREFKEIMQEQIQDSKNPINVYAYSDFVSPFEIEENGISFKENATIKLRAIYNAFYNTGYTDSMRDLLQSPLVFIAEDSGLCVPMLDNEPGIYSARYCEFLKTQRQNLSNTIKLYNSADEANLLCLCEKLSRLKLNTKQGADKLQISAFFIAHIAFIVVLMRSCIETALDSGWDFALPPFESLQVEYCEGILHGKVIDKPRGERGFGYDPIFIPAESNPHKQTLAEFLPSAKNAISHRKKAFFQCIKQLLTL